MNIKITGSGSYNYLDQSKFKKANIKIEFNEINHPVYNQKNSDLFIPGLSILDLIMNCGLKKTEKLIKCK